MPRLKKKYIELEERRVRALARLRPSYLRQIRLIKRFRTTRAIYFLCQADEIVYVGQSKDLGSRLNGHGDKFYNRVYFISCPEKTDLNRLESFFITLLRPKYNKVGYYGDGGCLFVSSKNLASYLGITVRKAKSLAQPPLREGASEWFDRETLLNFLSGAIRSQAVAA